jgi:serine/threonine-protein kinase
MSTRETGRLVAGYRIERMIGSGGMGVVYEATQLALERSVALKLLAPGLSESPGFRERFKREATMQAALEHPHVVPIYEAGESEDGLFIAMRLVRGADLRGLADEGADARRVVAVLEQAASALDAAHEAGLVHRDVKPQNILVGDNDHAYLADFGLTRGPGERRSTSTGYTGSLDYAAPEVIRGEPAGTAADVYAFAAVMLEALTGEVPYPESTEAALLYAHLSKEPPRATARRSDLPGAVDVVIARGLAKQPENRYRTAGDLVADARRALAAAPGSPAAAEPRRFNETVVDAPILRAAPVIALDEKRERAWKLYALSAVVLAALAAGAFGIGRALGGSGGGAQGHVQSGPLELSFRSGAWKPARAPAIPGLELQNVVALRSASSHRPATLVAGIAPAAQGPGLLPATVRSQLTAPAPAHAVRLVSAEGLDYPSLPAGRMPWRVSLLLVPTARGAATVACLVPRVLEAGDTPGSCESVAATLQLHGLRALSLGQTTSYGNAVSSILTLLDGERLAARRQLAGATTRAEQSRAAAATAAGFAGAAASVARLSASPLARPAQAALVAALQSAGADYAAVGRAAAHGDAKAYAAATAKVDAVERRVDAATAQLARVRAG